MALVSPLPSDHDLETKELAQFFNETLGFCPNSVLDNATSSGNK